MLFLSIRPKFVAKIFAGRKRVELRRRKPRLQDGDLVAIYATAPRCELVGLARVVGIQQGTPGNLWRTVKADAAVNRQEYDSYFEGSERAIGIVLEEPVEFQNPAPLEQLRDAWPGFRPPQGFCYLTPQQIELIDDLRDAAERRVLN
jgi:predicted transcriptional regulator